MSSDPHRFRLTLSYSDADFAAYERATLRRHHAIIGPGAPVWVTLSVAGALAIVFALGFAYATGLSRNAGALLAMLIFGLLYFGGWLFDVIHGAARAKQQKRLLEALRPYWHGMVLSIGPRGAGLRARGRIAFYPWAEIADVSREDGLVCIWTEPDAAIAIPSRLLDAEQTAFILSRKPAG